MNLILIVNDLFFIGDKQTQTRVYDMQTGCLATRVF